jgi:Tol biopolymer transport system component
MLTLAVSIAAAHRDETQEDGPQFGPWSVPAGLGPIVNSAFADAGPGISKDGLSLYFHSARLSAGGETDLYVSHRAAVDLPWGAPANLGAAVNSIAPDVTPTLSRDSHYLFFASSRSGNFDIYVSHRRNIHDDFDWEAPIALPTPVNGPSFDAGPSYVENSEGQPQMYFASDRANGLGQPGLDIYMTELLADGTWTTPTLVNEVNSAFTDNRPAIRFDGLEMALTSTRDGNQDIYVSRRNHLWEPWSTPEPLGLPINTGASENQAAFSGDGRTLYFASTRPGGRGDFDLYASTRARTRGQRD